MRSMRNPILFIQSIRPWKYKDQWGECGEVQSAVHILFCSSIGDGTRLGLAQVEKDPDVCAQV